ncbi:MAG: hypothetical protein GY804_11685 [Alphaproteobacteria bacterium]|nr:hypothetical protein [Alphaproteobacteria bacterium]
MTTKMKQDKYSQINNGVCDFKGGMAYQFTLGQNTQCRPGQSVFESAEERHGKNAVVKTSLNAYHFAPFWQDVEKYGDPVGTVTVRQRESFYIYLRRVEKDARLTENEKKANQLLEDMGY